MMNQEKSSIGSEHCKKKIFGNKRGRMFLHPAPFIKLMLNHPGLFKLAYNIK